MYSMSSIYRKFYVPADMQIGLYHTLVLPVITYASEIWGFDVIRDIALLQVKDLKHLLYVHKKTSNDLVYGKLRVCLIQVYQM